MLAILRQRCGRWTEVELTSGQQVRVFDIAWGRDTSADFDHLTTNISPGPSSDSALAPDFFHTSDVAFIRDPETRAILFGHATPTT